jgi:hypothetical protein
VWVIWSLHLFLLKINFRGMIFKSKKPIKQT